MPANIAAAMTVVILVAVIVEDLRFFRIRNVFVVALLGCFALDAVIGRRAEPLVPHLLFGGGGFLVLLIMFARGWIGGGDAKLLTSALLWTGPSDAVAFSLLLMITTLGYIAGAHLAWLPAREVRGRRTIPFGPSISAAWILLVVFQYLDVDRSQNN